jgi:subtilisin family serine protease
LADFESRARARSRRAQPDLAGYYIVQAPKASISALKQMGERLQALPEVEYVEVEILGVPPPGDIPPVTPDLVSLQTYLASNPGLDVAYARSRGVLGAGVRVSDCEYGWTYSHEDLVDINLHPEPGHTIHSNVFVNGWEQHGTAVAGQLVAAVNAYGCSGICPDVAMYTYSEYTQEGGYRRTTCIANAIVDSDPGDIVLLEMQSTDASGQYVPAEYSLSVWQVVKAGVDAGVIVVGAAGNGAVNLDLPAHSNYQARGDSGAILVGAGTANTSHDRLSFSTYGSRVNVQGWGQSVFTLGYGGYATYGGDTNQKYTATFSGTSSASPFVAGAGALLQSFRLQQGDEPLYPSILRSLLIATGIPQGSGGHIGPFINLRAAISEIETNMPPMDLLLTNETAAATRIYQATRSITARDGYRITPAGDVRFEAGGWIRLENGFRAERGSDFRAVPNPP